MTRYLFRVAFLMSAAACATPVKQVPEARLPASATAGDAESVVKAFVAAHNRHDVPAMLELVDTGFVWLSLVGDSIQVETRGRDALKGGMESYFRSIPTARSTIESISSLGPWVSIRERAHWRTEAGARSQAAMSMYEVREGRLRRVWYYPVVRE
ncbi:MAG: nuclear transport factor 2 family protein [Gemmatimonadaceae bacterium]|nr:nuclear transport factor 2 family protein [Gemmatimonadaceae bacterium]MDQ3516788.1 nuclear transport factor 2 family protein [Gemmatimonadota bacterium]